MPITTTKPPERSQTVPTPDDVKRRRPPLAGSSEELAETALVVGYRPGVGSCIGREE
jgi:hypothetical protein